jgi:hypothetical protein
LTWYESDIARSLVTAARQLEQNAPTEPIRAGYALAFVRLSDVFGWERSDRVLHEALDPADAHVFFVALGRSLRATAPDYAGRYSRPRPASEPYAGEQPALLSWRSAWMWGCIVMVVVQLARCAGETRTPVQPPPRIQMNMIEPMRPRTMATAGDVNAIIPRLLSHDPTAINQRVGAAWHPAGKRP